MSGESENYLGVRKRFTSGQSVSWIGLGEDFEDFDGDVVVEDEAPYLIRCEVEVLASGGAFPEDTSCGGVVHV